MSPLMTSPKRRVGLGLPELADPVVAQLFDPRLDPQGGGQLRAVGPVDGSGVNAANGPDPRRRIPVIDGASAHAGVGFHGVKEAEIFVLIAVVRNGTVVEQVELRPEHPGEYRGRIAG